MIIDYIYPPQCFACTKDMYPFTSKSLCFTCWKKIGFNVRKCAICKQQKTSYCCQAKYGFTEFRCVAKYENTLKQLLIDFKFNRKVHCGSLLANLLFRSIQRIPFSQKIDYVIPVPMTAAKRFVRGYNHSEIIALHLAKKMHIYCIRHNLVKIKNTRSQSSLKKSQRLLNLENTFYLCNKRILSAKNILLVDDICTTGSTLRECMRVLRQAKCKNIYVAVIAY